MTDPIHNYSQNAWQGDKYDSSLDIKEIAKRLRTHLKSELPDHKFSVRIERYSGGQSMSILLMSAPYKPIIESISEEWKDGDRVIVTKPVTEQNCQLNHHCLDDYKSQAETPHVKNNGYVIDKRATDAMKIAVAFASGFNYVDSEIMTDYFSTNFYLHCGIGQWDKDCKYPNDAEKLIDDLDKMNALELAEGIQEELCENIKEENNILWLYRDEIDVNLEDYSV